MEFKYHKIDECDDMSCNDHGCINKKFETLNKDHNKYEIIFDDEQDNCGECNCEDDKHSHSHLLEIIFEEEMESLIKCQGCAKLLPVSNFPVKSDGKLHKRCNPCRQKRIKLTRKTKKKSGICEDCDKQASFNYEGETKRRKCKQHSLPGMINVAKRYCDQLGCYRTPSFNYEGETKGLYCKLHAKVGMINTRDKKCRFEGGCTKAPVYNYPTESGGRFCKDHKTDDMVNVKTRRCKYGKCKKIPTCNYPGKKNRLYCLDHALDNMICMNRRYCTYSGGCKSIAKFNIEGATYGIFCKKHSKKDMIDIYSKRCEYNGCYKIPHFNYVGNKSRRFCKEHADPNMVNVGKSKCLECDSKPNYNYNIGDKPIYCAKHKKKGMKNTRKQCNHEGCEKTPNFNYEGETKGLFCSNHKKDGMINVRKKNCDKCDTKASYGIPGNRVSRCVSHIEEGMIRQSRKKCKYENCKELAIFGNVVATHCENHKEEDEINLIYKKCKHKDCNELNIVNEFGICGLHDPALLNRTRLQKQKRVKFLIENNIEHKIMSYDKMIDSGICNKRRPDIVINVNTHFVIIEIDENQHISKKCEESRMVEIWNSLGLPVVFIRYNPDSFTDKSGNKSNIRKNIREDILIKWIKQSLNLKLQLIDGIQVVYLFYNGYDIANNKYERLNIPDFK